MRRIVTWLFVLRLSCVAMSAFAAESREWIPLNKANNSIDVDYRSIDLKGKNISLDLRQRFVKLQTDSGVSFDAVIHHYAVDCEKQMLDRLSSHAYVANVAGNEGAELHLASGSDHVALAGLKSLCIWRQHGFLLPDIKLDGIWEDMEPTSSVIRIFESPKRRQKKDGLVMLTVRNDFVPPMTADGTTWSHGIAVALYQCEKSDANVTVSLLYDADKKPLTIAFYSENSALPKLDANRERFAASCN